MTTLRERKTNRKAILRSLYDAVEHNRPEVSGSALRAELGLPDEDLSAACAYLADEGLISVDWTSHRTPAAVSLTHEGVRLMEQQEEEQEDKGEKAQEEQSDN
ncbi:hypothetical protein ACFYNZ_02010 [Streptomyces kebangsaanensis]|uniref:ArsR family transcriptional regulator n=1 Tax=Streptomyces kebangsaanensis TaxID=864058 RepID=A0ABW6KP80_9ACTN